MTLRYSSPVPLSLRSLYFAFFCFGCASPPAPPAPSPPPAPEVPTGSTVAGHEDRIVYVPRSQTLALSDRIPALKENGVTTIYLADVTGTGPDVLNPAELALPLDEASARGLVAAIRSAGMDAILEVELNHVAEGSPLVGEYPEWFHDYGLLRDFDDVEQRQFFDLPGTRDFAQERPEVSSFLIGTASSFADRAPISGLGFKHVSHVPMPFWAELVWASAGAVDAPFRTVGRYHTASPTRLAFALRHGRFSEVFDRPFHLAAVETFCGTAPNERLAAVLSSDSLYRRPEALITYLDGLDDPLECDEASMIAGLTVQHGVRGRPMLRERTFTDERQSWLLRLQALRRNHPVFFDGESKLVAAGRAGIFFLRIGRGEIGAVLFNAGDSMPLSVPLPLGVPASSLVEALGVSIEGGKLVVPPRSAGLAVFRRVGSLDWLSRKPRAVSLTFEGAPPDAVLRCVHPAFGNGKPVPLRGPVTASVSPGTAVELELRGAGTVQRRYLFVDYQRGPLERTFRWSSP
ncbi:MAG: hypothetical protein AAFU77_04830 [Myxococcota bacterium]